MVKKILKTGDLPSPAMLKAIESASKKKQNTEDIPELSQKALKEFAAMAKEKRKRKSVPLRLNQRTIDAYKNTIGKGYTTVMADILEMVIDNPDFLKKLTK